MELTKLYWAPEKLTASLIAAASPAAREAAALAELENPAKRHIAIRLSKIGTSTFQIRGVGQLAGAFEFGTHEHEEEPRGLAFKFTRGSGGFARGPIQVGGMAAQPYLRPAAAAFPALYRRSASAAMSRGIAGVL